MRTHHTHKLARDHQNGWHRAGADPGRADGGGHTALHFAASCDPAFCADRSALTIIIAIMVVVVEGVVVVVVVVAVIILILVLVLVLVLILILLKINNCKNHNKKLQP